VTFDVASAFESEFNLALLHDQQKSGFELKDWFRSGPQLPLTSVQWWREHGPGQVQNYIDWFESSGAAIWWTPEGRKGFEPTPAIELDLTVNFGDVAVRMVIDQVLSFSGALVVVDLKSSAKLPSSTRQLGIYASGIELAFGIRPRYGTYFMTRGVEKKGETTYFQRPIELSGYEHSVEYLTREFAMVEKGITQDLFPAHPGDNCFRCGVAWACSAVGGSEARNYDKTHPEYREDNGEG
jgi:hypothetical protein